MGAPEERVVVAVEVDDTPWCPTGSELVADRLFSLGASAVSELDGVPLRLVADLPPAALGALADGGLHVEVLERDPAWSTGWREHATAVRAGERIVVRPEWVAPDPSDREDGDVEVVVDAAASFGSGSHPTTRLCLGLLERLVARGDRVLDVGCGTGVLGAAALVLGAGSLVAVDVEAAAVAATARTARLNGVGDRVLEVSDRRLAEVVGQHGRFDLVLANLLVPIVEELGAGLAAAVAPAGRLVVSGLLADGAQVERAVTAVGRPVTGVDELDGWAAVTFG